jgi:hypothetical protein
VDFLERTARVDNRFVADFRRRPPWTVTPDVDLFGKQEA